MNVIMNAEIEFDLRQGRHQGVVFTDMGNAFNLEDQYCKIRPSVVDNSKNPACPLNYSAYRQAGGSGFAGSRRSALRSNGASKTSRGATIVFGLQSATLNVLSRRHFLRRTNVRVTQFLVAAVFLLARRGVRRGHELGYVDMQRALNETDDGRKAKEKLKKEFDQKQKELDEQQTQLKKEIEDLDKKRSLLTPDKIRDKEAELRSKLEKVQQTYMRHQKDLSEKEQKETAKIFERMTKIIGEIAAAENFSAIVDKSALVYAKPHLDLTNELIRRYTAAAGSGAAGSPSNHLPKK